MKVDARFFQVGEVRGSLRWIEAFAIESEARERFNSLA
jgi:hypothetical protein